MNKSVNYILFLFLLISYNLYGLDVSDMNDTFWDSISVEILEEYINSGLDVNDREKGEDSRLTYTVLMKAAMYCDNHAVVEELIKAGADPSEYFGIFPILPLGLAINYDNSLEVIKMLYKYTPKEAITDGQIFQFFEGAINNLNEEVFDYLLSIGLDKDTRGMFGNTLFSSVAEYAKDIESVKMVFKRGYDIQARDYMGFTVLMNAVNSPTDYEIIKFLLENGANGSERNYYGQSVIGISASRSVSSPEILKLIIDSGADIDYRNDEKETPLMMAIYEQQSINKIRILVENGADINARDNSGYTPLIHASRYNTDTRVVRFLLNNGASINVRNEYGETALMLAAYDNQNPYVVDTLLRAGANTKLKANNGMLAIDSAQNNEILMESDIYHKLYNLTYSGN